MATAVMMTKKKAAELNGTLEQRRAELEKARAEIGLVSGDTLEAYEARTAAALKRYKEVVIPPLRDQVQQLEKRCPPPRPAVTVPTTRPAAPTTAASSSGDNTVAELKEKLAQIDKRLAQLEKEQSVRDVAMDAVQALDEKAEVEKALAAAQQLQQPRPSTPQSQPQQPQQAAPEPQPETTRFAAERWIATRLTAFEQDAARGLLAEPSAASFAAPSNADLPTMKDLGLVKVEPVSKPAGSTAGLDNIFQ
jgi:hypothetical protein